MTAITLNLEPLTTLTHEQFYKLCMANKDIVMEHSPTGELLIMSPIGGESSEREANYIADLVSWNRQTGLGIVFSSSTVFKLPGGGSGLPLPDILFQPDIYRNSLSGDECLSWLETKVGPLRFR